MLFVPLSCLLLLSDPFVRFAATVTAAAAVVYVVNVIPGVAAAAVIAAVGCVASTLLAIAGRGKWLLLLFLLVLCRCFW